MQPSDIKRLLAAVRARRMSLADALERLKALPVENLGYARYDTHRALRRGFPEVIFGPNAPIFSGEKSLSRKAASRDSAASSAVG